ncbi:MAG: SAM-dependent chlorinase/fluorinase [Bacteroidales bacterium]|nr:SAM-dependent chlorinase/fluorinase [Bacteroidales bacterium]
MAIITLTSDWGTADYYAAAVKGVILSKLPSATIVDITHDIAPFNIAQAGFTLRNCYRNFPEGTIHIIAVDTIESDVNPHVVVKAQGQYFISTDNGIFSHILENGYEEAVFIDVEQDTDFFTFSTRDRFAKVAVMIANGEPLSNIGARREHLNDGGTFCATVKNNIIEGIVIHIDSYENIITNITQSLFEEVGKGRDFLIKVKGDLYTIDELSESYDDVAQLDPVAIFGTHGYLEIALNHAKLASLWGIEIRSTIQVVFED